AFLLEFYGLASHSITVALTDYSQFHNMLKPIGAILNGRAISYQEARHYRPTAAARTSWGNLKSRTSPR
ncbi:MAG: hypothetical protein HW385_1639, partial [candidate division NC10 bacterium]|nr:hypothetical protein [candidate division NC10 bacterium]